MRWRRIGAIIAVAQLLGPLNITAFAPSSASTPCAVGGQGAKSGILVRGICVRQGEWGPHRDAPPTKTISCGKATGLSNLGWNRACGEILTCYAVKDGKNVQRAAFATQTREGGRWSRPVVWCPQDAQPAVTLAAIRQQVLRLLPRVPIGSAWSTTALVNAEVVLWAGTGTERTLPTVAIVGQQVALRIHLTNTHWNFGDGESDDTTDPGKPYDSLGDPCRTRQCEHYYGHTYLHTGRKTITLAVSWHAQYRTGGDNWTDLDPALTGPTSSHTITLKQARGVLIQNPGGN